MSGIRCRQAALAAFLFVSAAAAEDLPSDAPNSWAAPPFWMPTVRRMVAREQSAREAEGSRPQAIAATSPLPFVAIAPCRMLDTRITGGSIASGTTRTVVLTGAPCGIPAGAAAVSANFAVFNITGAAGNGVLILTPTGTADSQALINWSPTFTQIDNASVVPLGTGDAIDVRPQQGGGSIDLVVDVNGYYAGSVVTNIAPGTGLTGGGTGNVTLGIAPGGVTSTELATNAVTSGKIAANAVTSGRHCSKPSR